MIMSERSDITTTEEDEVSFGSYIKQVVYENGYTIKEFVAQIELSEKGRKYGIKENRVYKILEDRRIPNLIEVCILIEVSQADPVEAYKRAQSFYSKAISKGIFLKEDTGDE